MHKALFATFLFISLCAATYSQPQKNNWFFASINGLNFSSGNPITIPGQVGHMEGASAISDKNGQLLFYTDGIHVWNKQHVVMPNGNGLHGGYGSATQSSVIIPKTTDGLQYYIFTADEEGGFWGLQYSVVDMTLDGGKGDVTGVKNIPLVTPISEKITAVIHCDKKSYWIITHKYGSGDYYSYRTDENGVNATPIISHTGSFIPITYATMAGALKASPDGKKLAAAHGDIGVELADFNNQTGIVSNCIGIFDKDIPGICYGVEFSANSSFLYASITHYWDWTDFVRYSGVFQFNVSLPTKAAIIASTVQLFRYPSGNEMGSLERGPNGKIYMSQYQKSYLSVINAPDVAGAACSFVNNGLALPHQGLFSLPNLINNYIGVKDSFSINAAGTCINKPVSFNYTTSGDVLSLLWDFDDPVSGANNSSPLSNPTHIFISNGIYNVKLIKYSPCGNDTIIKQINVGNVDAELGNNKNFCDQSSVVLDPQSTGTNTYLWQDGSTSATYTASTAGLYWVQVSSTTNGCIKRDSIVLAVKPMPIVALGKDTSLCVGKTMTLDAGNTGAQYAWQDNSTGQAFVVNQDGKYWVQVDLNGCIKSDTIIVSKITKPHFSLGPDNYLCPGLTLQLKTALQGNNSYIWQDGTTIPDYVVKQSGLYYVDITNICGMTRDSINIFKGNCTVYVPSAFTPDRNGRNDYFKVSGTGLVEDFDMKIFDRAGQIIFSTKDKNKGWDGRFKNEDLPIGVYVYLIKYTELIDKTPRVLKGTITILR